VVSISSYNQALKYIDEHSYRHRGEPYKGDEGLRQAAGFFTLLGNPQDEVPAIHIAGTSGKGSTAMMISAILAGHGFKVGLTVSPHVYDIRERLQINNHLIPEPDFAAVLNSILPIANKFKRQMGREPSYFELLIGMAFKYFAANNTDYMVIETGLGGLLDATNTIHRQDKAAVITRIGIDHAHILGNRVKDIATQKAGIIHTNNTVIALKQSPSVNRVIKARALEKKARVDWVSTTPSRDHYLLENQQVAAAAVKAVSQRDSWQLNVDKQNIAIKNLKLPGRFEELILGRQTFILDGAHNEQKLNALINSVKKKYPARKFGFILGMKDNKSIFTLDGPSVVIATAFNGERQDMEADYADPKGLAKKLSAKHPEAKVITANSLTTAIESATRSPLTLWIITGSFFLLKPAKAILSQAT